MIIVMTAALAAAQPAAPAPSPAQHEQLEQKGSMNHMSDMAGMGHMQMSKKQMADCGKCCEEMMAKMHHSRTQHKGHAG